MMKETFENAMIEVIVLELSDVITTSGGPEGKDPFFNDDPIKTV